MRSVLIDTLTDAGAAAGVAIAGTVTAVTVRFQWLDRAIALAVCLLVPVASTRTVKAIGSLRSADIDFMDD